MKSRNKVLYYGKKAVAFLASVLLLSVLLTPSFMLLFVGFPDKYT